MGKKALVTFVTLLLIVSSASAILHSGDADAEIDIYERITKEKNVTFIGKVSFNLKPLTEQDLPNIVVLIVESLQNPSAPEKCYITNPFSERIKADGSFSIDVPRIIKPGVNYYLLVESGYEIEIIQSEWFSTTPETIARYEDADIDDSEYPATYSDAYRLENAPGMKTTDEMEVWPVSGTGDDSNVIGVMRVAGTVSITAVYNDYNLSNVMIGLLREGETEANKDLTGSTDSNGVCTIYDVPTGWYTVTSELKDYEQKETIRIYVQKNQTASSILEMAPTSSDRAFWGFDLPHFLMISAGVIGLIIAITSGYLQHRVITGRGRDLIYDDLRDDGDE